MRYTDKNTLISRDKHLDRLDNRFSSDRELRRLDKKNYQKFILKFSGKIGKDWWECLDEFDKVSIIKDHDRILRISRLNRKKPDWNNWIKNIKQEYKPNVALYRERMIDKVLK